MGRQETIEKLKNELDELNEKLDLLEAKGEKIEDRCRGEVDLR